MGKRRGDGVERWQELGSHRAGTGSSTATAFDAQRRRQTSQPKHLQCCFSRIGTDTAASSFVSPSSPADYRVRINGRRGARGAAYHHNFSEVAPDCLPGGTQLRDANPRTAWYCVEKVCRKRRMTLAFHLIANLSSEEAFERLLDSYLPVH